MCSRFEDLQPLKLFKKYFNSETLTHPPIFLFPRSSSFGVAVSSQSPALGNVRFYFLYSKSGCSNTFNPFLPVALNTGYYSNISHRGTSARCGQIRYSKRAVCLLLFRASILGYGGEECPTDGEHPTSKERFILPIKPARSREFNPFHRKHHKSSNASSERRSNKTAFGWCFRCFASPMERNRLSSPLCAVALNRPLRDNLPALFERNSLVTSLCAHQTRTLCIHIFLLIAPMPPTINSLRGIVLPRYTRLLRALSLHSKPQTSSELRGPAIFSSWLLLPSGLTRTGPHAI